MKVPVAVCLIALVMMSVFPSLSIVSASTGVGGGCCVDACHCELECRCSHDNSEAVGTAVVLKAPGCSSGELSLILGAFPFLTPFPAGVDRQFSLEVVLADFERDEGVLFFPLLKPPRAG